MCAPINFWRFASQFVDNRGKRRWKNDKLTFYATTSFTRVSSPAEYCAFSSMIIILPVALSLKWVAWHPVFYLFYRQSALKKRVRLHLIRISSFYYFFFFFQVFLQLVLKARRFAKFAAFSSFISVMALPCQLWKEPNTWVQNSPSESARLQQ